MSILPPIGVIFEELYEGYRYCHYLDWGTVAPTFQNEIVKNLLLPAVNRGDLRRLNYNKTVFGQLRLMTLFQTLESDGIIESDTFSPLSSPLDSGPNGVSFSF